VQFKGEVQLQSKEIIMNSKLIKYSNPVWNDYMADPFVLKYKGEYWAYGTGRRQPDGRWFPVLHSKNLTEWEEAGGALEPLQDPKGTAYWAPEVIQRGGTFYMYYSAASNEEDDSHRLRLAVADHPAGPFRDFGRPLLPDQGFSIDAHAFQDPKDGQWYLFFARDFFDERVGTGVAVVPLADDMVTPLDSPRTVIRASSDWHIYQRNRSIYGRTWDAWHTIEGPFVLFHKGLYYCLYSGGSWQSTDYGVGFGVAEQPLGPYRDEWNTEGPAVLRGIPGRVLGPGHCSVTTANDDRTEFLVYHAWDVESTARRMCIDPLIWEPHADYDHPRCAGPTDEPQELQL
jgi:arabinan endo-1,5-alpha-L-arabinosidase